MTETMAFLELLWLLMTDPGSGVLIGLLLVAAVVDCRTLRIPNWLTAGGLLYGLAYNAAHATSAGAGLATAALGAAAGLATLLPLYVMRVLGAGDVKLMAAAGAFLGPGPVFTAALFVFVAGGIAAVAFAVSRRATLRFGQNLRFVAWGLLAPASGAWQRGAAAMPSIGKLPYGVSICAGTVAFLVTRQLGFA